MIFHNQLNQPAFANMIFEYFLDMIKDGRFFCKETGYNELSIYVFVGYEHENDFLWLIRLNKDDRVPTVKELVERTIIELKSKIQL